MEFAQGRNDKPFKFTFHQSEQMLVGLNCLQPGQSQPLHDHLDQDKIYLVLNGSGLFHVGGASSECFAGHLVLCPAGVPHGVENNSLALLTFLTVIAPASAPQAEHAPQADTP